MEYRELYDMLFDSLKKLLYPEEWIALDMSLSKSELLTLLQVDRNGEIIMSRIADYINIPMSTATGLIERLVRKGYIERSRSESDRRIVTIRLTGEGRKLTDGMKQTIGSYIQPVWEALTDEEKELLFSIFTKVSGILSSKSQETADMKGGGIPLKKIEIE